jgi:hypothetical protein
MRQDARRRRAVGRRAHRREAARNRARSFSRATRINGESPRDGSKTSAVAVVPETVADGSDKSLSRSFAGQYGIQVIPAIDAQI